MRLPNPLRSTFPFPTLLRLAIAALLPLATAACGGGGGGSDGPALPPQLVADLYVDAQAGSDANDGTLLSPFKTITHAMTQAAPGMKVKVQPGFYDAGNGESFPISIPNGIQLLGDLDHKGKGSTPTMIIGYGTLPPALETNSTATLTPSYNVIIAGFVIQNTHSDPISKASGVVIASSDVQLLGNTIQFNENTGVRYLAGGIGGHVLGNVFQDNGTGIFFKAGGQNVRVQSNSITKNGAGVLVWVANIDLGGGIAGSLGKNTIAFNGQADLLIMGQVHVMARDNRWNHVPPTLFEGNSGVPAGIDVWNLNGAGSFDALGAKLPQIIISALPSLPFVPVGP